jgi:ribose/xylose/arabinose/galactoside ABC-type transport system permease subunit
MTTIETPAPQQSGTLSSGSRLFRLASRYGTQNLVAFLALIAFNIAVTPNFLSWQTLNVNLTQVATIVIVATGMTLVIATGGIDLSVGSLMAISGALAPMIFMGSSGRWRTWRSP